MERISTRLNETAECDHIRRVWAHITGGIKINYRAEIDGLRALAVLPVIFFHAGFQTFSGGFVGVDVFFVISGYLITTIILAEKQAGTFSLINFYERRARRILPALFFVMLACLPFAWLWLMPSDMKIFSQSLVAVSGFVSNVLFWRSSGYFAPAAELNALLHTWSLAVEEQYYLVFPIFLMLAWRLGKRWILMLLTIVAILSLAAAQWFSVSKPEATFYLLPTRGWEILIGAFVAFYFSSAQKPNISASVSQIGSIVGLLLIIYAIFSFDKKTPSPSLYTMLPTIGTALILLFASQRTLVGKLLGNKLFVGIGLISYSAYLWHQPLFAFAKHRSIEEPSKLLLVVLAISSIVLAYFSWRFIETPFRSNRGFTRKKIFVLSFIGTVFFATFGFIGHFSNGFENRIDLERREFLSYFENRPNMAEKYRTECDFYDLSKHGSGYPTRIPISKISEVCFIKDHNARNVVFIWGDSHAQQLYPGLKEAIPASWQILQVASSGCKAELNAAQNKNDYCEYSNWFAYNTIVETKPDVVIVGQNLNHNAENMIEISERLKRVGVKKVVFTGPTPHWKADLPKIIAQKLWEKTPRRTFVGIDSDVMKLDKKVKTDFPKSNFASYVSLIDYFCSDAGCIIYLGNDRKTEITTWDYGHLTPIASYYFAQAVLVKEVISGVE